MRANGVRYYEFGEFRLDVRQRVLLKNGRPVKLTARNFDLLLVMVENDGRVLTHDELLEKVWQGLFVEQSNLKKGISALRHVFEESSTESAFIKTVPRKGYSFVAPVRAVAEEARAVLYRETEAELLVEEIVEEDEATAAETARPAPAGARDFWRRRKYLIAVCSVTFVLAGVGAWLLLRPRGSTSRPRLEELRMQKLTSGGNVRTAAVSPDGRTVVYATLDENNRQTLWTKRAGLQGALQLVAPAADVEYQAIAFSPDGNLAYYGVTVGGARDYLYRVPVYGGEPRKIVENITSAASFSPDGRRIAFARDVAGVGRVLLTAGSEDGGGERQVYAVTDNHRLIEPRWSPDGRHIAFISSETIEGRRIWTVSEVPAEGGEARHILPPQRGKIYYFEWARDSAGLVLAADPDDSTQTQLWYSTYPGGEKTRLTNDVNVYRELSLSADGNTILAVQKEKLGDLWSMDWPGSPDPVRLTQSQNYTGGFSVLPDGKILAETLEDGRRGLSFVSADGREASQLFSQGNMELNPAVSPDGRTLLFTSRRSGEEEVWQSDLDGRNARRLTDEKTFVSFPRLSPDGRYLYFGRYDGAGWRFVRMPAQGGRVEALTDETFWAYDFSPDGGLLAYSFFDERKKRWQVGLREVATNAVRGELDVSPMTFVRWTRDGRSLIYNDPGIFREGGNLWSQPVDGGPARLLLDVKEDKVFWADWSPDGRKLYFTRGRSVSNIVLLTRGRPE